MMSEAMLTTRSCSRGVISRARCPHCGDNLSLCQPDGAKPDRLLGSCPGCEAWYVVDGHRRVLLEVLRPEKAEEDADDARPH